MTPAEAKAHLAEWQKVYEGLLEEEILEVAQVALDRTHFMRERDEEKE